MITLRSRGVTVWIVATVLAAFAGAGHCDARDLARGPIDTENLFGFLTGTDVGEAGEKELEGETTGRFGRRTGGYTALAQSLGLEYTPNDRLRLELSAVLDHHDISGGVALDDVRQTGFQGLSFEMRYRLIDRREAGIGLALRAEPHWSRIDDTSGQPADQYGADLALLLDKELVPDRIIAALNLLYEPDATRLHATGAWSRDATAGLGAAVMARAYGSFFIGAEVRYLRAYDGLGIVHFAGDALFVGPNLFFKPSPPWRITAAWSRQVAGAAVNDPGPLDLTNFERHQAKLRVAYEF